MAPPRRDRSRYPLILLVVLVAWGVALGIKPWHRDDWALENALAVLAVSALVITHKRFPLSRFSYTLIFVFLFLHEFGAHYTYSEVPYDEWLNSLTGHTLKDTFGFTRNHYDRFVHFMYGFLLAYPMREMFVRIADVRGFWGYFLPLDLTMSTSMIYELVEWAAVLAVGSDLGQAYLGTQGDEWDAHKDMLLASLGAALAMTITAIVHRRLDRDFQREWADSLKVRKKTPLGEEEVERLKKRHA